MIGALLVPQIALRIWIRNHWGPKLFVGTALGFVALVLLILRLSLGGKEAALQSTLKLNDHDMDYWGRIKAEDEGVKVPEREKGQRPEVGDNLKDHGRPAVPPPLKKPPQQPPLPRHGGDKKEGSKPGSEHIPPRKSPNQAGEEEPIPADAGKDQKIVQAEPILQQPSSSDDRKDTDILPTSPEVWTSRAEAVKQAFLHSWEGYRKYAWGYDHLLPLSKTGEDWFGLGLTIVDSLDTMWIMNLTEEFKLSRDWVANDLKFSYDGDVGVGSGETLSLLAFKLTFSGSLTVQRL